MANYQNSDLNEDADFNGFFNHLWSLDKNRLVLGKDFVLDMQSSTRNYHIDGPDKADRPLFSRVEQSVLKRPTYKAFIALLDNYISAIGSAEKVSSAEIKENKNFMKLVLGTAVMKHAHRFLVNKGKVDKDIKKFQQKVYDLWFALYSRSSFSCDSSGFEHVFVGETKNRQVKGFHNWIQFYLQEKTGKVDYNGYILNDKNPHLVTVKFQWGEDVKPVGSMFIGVSPEFEMALYTVCYYMDQKNYHVKLNGESLMIKCFKEDGKMMACYPMFV